MAELLERASALATLRQLLHAAKVSGHVALVSGDAGKGKKRVLRALAEACDPVWWARCDALETPHPLAPLLDIACEQQPRFAAQLAGPRPALFDAVIEEPAARCLDAGSGGHRGHTLGR